MRRNRLGTALETLEDRAVPDASYFALNSTPTGVFSQDWTNTGLLTSNNDWSAVPSIVGFNGAGLAPTPGTAPGSVTSGSSGAQVVSVDQTNPNTFAPGGVAEFQISNPTVALSGSSSAQAPSLVLYMDTRGTGDIVVSFNARDLVSTSADTVSSLAVQYRVDPTGVFAGKFTTITATGDVTIAGGTTSTPVRVTLPAAANNQPFVQIRIITTNATDPGGADAPDEWIGIDDIVVDGNMPPVITTDSSTLDYVENDQNTFIDSAMGLSDPDSTDFNGGVLTVNYAQVPTAADRIFVNNQGTGNGQISWTGTVAAGITIRYTTGAGTQTIGTANANGGVGTTPLIITFNSAAATQPAIRALLRNLRYINDSDDPLGGIRRVQLVISDGDGQTSNLAYRDINVIPVNDEPVFSGLSGPPLVVQENDPPITIAPSVVITDPDSHDYDGGNLTFFMPAAVVTPFDNLTIQNQGTNAGEVGVNTATGEVTYSGTVIGTYTGGLGGTPLVITFNAASAPTPQSVQAVARAIQFQNTSDNPPASARPIRFFAFDNDADSRNTGISLTVQVTVTVQPVNDPPVLTPSTSGTQTYTENGPPMSVDPGLTLTDPDSLDFSSGTIVADFRSGGTVDDRLTIRSGGLVNVAGNAVQYDFGSGFVTIGTMSGGQGTTKLQVTFNPASTPASVEAVTQNVAYFNVSDNPATAVDRVVGIVVGDGDGGFSSDVTWTIHVVAVNDAPTIGNVPAAITYEAGFPAVVVAPASTVTDPDNSNFNTGVFTVAIAPAGSFPGDTVAIRNQGSGIGRIGLVGTNVTYSGAVIGSFTGGTPGNPLVVTLNNLATQPALQALANSITFRTPNGVGITGDRTLTFTAVDFTPGGATSTPVTQVVTVTSTAGPNDDFYETNEDVPDAGGVFTVSAANGVLKNDPNPAQLVANTTLVAPPAKGVVVLAADGGFTYTPAANTNGTDTFDYQWINTVTNAVGVARVTIVVDPVNDAPTATFTPTSITVLEDSGSYSKSGFAVFGPGGGLDEAGQTLTRTISNNNPSLFTAQPAIDGNGRLTFSTAPDANGTATVTVVVTDSGGTFNNVLDQDTATYTFTITITAVNDPPSFQLAGTSVSVPEDFGTKVVPSFALNFRPGPATAVDEASQTATYILTPLGVSGGLTFSTPPTIDPNGTLTFAAAPNSNGTAQYLVQVRDSGGPELSASRTFTITVVAVEDPPTLVNDTATVRWNSGPNVIDVLANDSALPDVGQTISVTAVTQPAHGTVVVQSGGTGVTYQPAAGFVGTDTFTYTVTDSGGGFATASVNVDVIRFQTQPVDIVAVAAGPGNGSKVRLYNAKTGAFVGGFSAYAPEFQGGVSVASADVNGDGIADIIVGAGPGGGPHIQVIDGSRIGLLQGLDQIAPPSALLANFFGYDFAYRGGVSVAAGDVDGDGKADIILGTGPGGGAHVRVISGAKVNEIGQDWQPLPSALLANFFAYDPAFRGGVGVATGDVNGDGYFDVLAAAGPGGASHVKAFSGRRLVEVGPNGPGVLLASFYAFDPNFRGGAVVSAGDFNSDGLDDFIVGAGPGGGPHVKVFSPLNLATPIASFYAFEKEVTGGISVGYRMRSGGSAPVLVVGSGSGAASRVNTYAAPTFTPIASAAVFDPGFLGGVDVG
ncbi:MAG: Ig-like domain-containing protein [Gemmataceae bacterium]